MKKEFSGYGLLCCFFLLLFSSGRYIFSQDFYWERPKQLTETDARFPAVVSDGTTTVFYWQEIDTKRRQIWLSEQRYVGNDNWQTLARFAGPFSYAGDIPDIYSAAMLPDGTIAVAVLSDIRTVSVYVSKDGGGSFTKVDLPQQAQPLVAPRVSAVSDGTFLLFMSLGNNGAFSMLSAKSADGMSWSAFSEFAPAARFTNPFIPVITSVPGGDLVVFQAQYNTGTRFSYQLFSSKSSDGGKSWSEPELVTNDATVPPGSSHPFYSYNNQRPSLCWFDGKLYMAWERTYYASENAHIWSTALDLFGHQSGDVREISTEGNASRPFLFEYGKELSLVWSDTRNGVDSVYFAQKKGFLWKDVLLSSSQTAAVFAFPLITDAGRTLSFIWQSGSSGKNRSPYITRLSPDHTVLPPAIAGLTFRNGERGKTEKEKVSVRLPADSSGIAGFSWIWTQDAQRQPPETLMRLPSQTTVTLNADHDSRWYFRARAVDYAGNWSKPAEITYFRDTTPPGKPVIDPSALDSLGFAASNNLHFSWKPAEGDDDVAGYIWSLDYIESIEKRITGYYRHPREAGDAETERKISAILLRNSRVLSAVPHLPKRLMGRTPAVSYKNKRNGVYRFSVAAVDSVGNTGSPSSVMLVLNKYVPYTYISSADRKTDIIGDMTVDLYGGGFLYDGTVKTVYIDRDGRAPYDITLSAASGQFRVLSDSRITGIHVDSTLPSGRYKIGLLHTDRGLYFSDSFLAVQENGTVKIENDYTYEPDWKPVTRLWRWHVQVGDILLWTICLLTLTGLVFAVYGLLGVARDAAAVRYEVQALLTGDSMPQEKRKRAAALRQRGTSLKIKLMSFTILLVLMIVGLAVVPLQYIMVNTQEQTLAEGLEKRVSVLMDGLSSGVRAYMPSRNVLELSYLPGQSVAMDEAEFATITGLPAAGSDMNLDYIWASNDPAIGQKIDTSVLTYGVSRLSDSEIRKITQRCLSLNDRAAVSVDELSGHISELNAEGIKLALKTDSYSVNRRKEIASVVTQLTGRVTALLNDISEDGAGSWPVYDTRKLDPDNTEYLFYKPVLYRQGNGRNYVQGVVFIKISTVHLLRAVSAARRTIFLTALYIAIIAATIGAVGSLFLATIIVRPIRRLADHVTMIGEVRNKEKLAGKDIVIRSHDEIGYLGETVNDMVHGLIKAAREEHLMLDGKIVQQTFLPLKMNGSGVKETTSVLKEPHIECFGYYEGASGVSGDYFDYRKLDGRWYVLIKCDVSGHGVPAALIMTIVATLFRRYFEHWAPDKDGTRIDRLVTQINDFIESLGLKGKFATIILCLLDTQTGIVYLCNAGDNIVHFYDSTARSEKTLTLTETPAAGPLPSFMVDMKGGFKVEKAVLKHNDVLFLYTDGIEEATRKFRDGSFKVLTCTEAGENGIHGNHKVGEDSEQLGPDRVRAIIESIFAHRVYRLEKYHNPVSSETLEFDFTTCVGTIEESILALISVEKVFRMYKDPFVSKTDTVRVDRKIDAFLKNHFNGYETYCSATYDDPEDPSYLYYTYLKEDEQLDDLTLLAVRRP